MGPQMAEQLEHRLKHHLPLQATAERMASGGDPVLHIRGIGLAAQAGGGRQQQGFQGSRALTDQGGPVTAQG